MKTETPDKLTVLDQFAIAALQGMIASESNGGGIMPDNADSDTWQRTAELAYDIADAMMEERARCTEPKDDEQVAGAPD